MRTTLTRSVASMFPKFQAAERPRCFCLSEHVVADVDPSRGAANQAPRQQ